MNCVKLTVVIVMLTVPISLTTAVAQEKIAYKNVTSSKSSVKTDDYSTLYARNAVKSAEIAVGAEDHTVASSLVNLANIYKHQGKIESAEPLYIRALAIYKKSLGPDHPNVALTLNHLADVYSTTGRYSEAEKLYLQAIAVDEKSSGPDQPEVANDMSNLANLYNVQKKYKESEEYYLRSMSIFEKAFGVGHPSIVPILSSLATIYQKTGRVDAAIKAEARAKQITDYNK